MSTVPPAETAAVPPVIPEQAAPTTGQRPPRGPTSRHPKKRRTGNFPHKHQNGDNDSEKIKATAFTGSTPEMNNRVFQTMAENGDRKQFNRTVEELEMLVLKQYGVEAADMLPIVRDLREPTLPKPEEIASDASKLKLGIWEKEVDCYVERKEALTANTKSLYAVVYGQCLSLMKSTHEIQSKRDNQL